MAIEDIRVVLVEPIYPGNIGSVARAMKTMSLTRLILVRPLEFPSYEADRRALGAVDILERAQIFEDLDTAIAEYRLVIGCSARPRTVRHDVIDARECGARLVAETAAGEPAALLFGPERTGLRNQDLDRCQLQVQIPTNEAFSSLNLASAVQLVVNEIFLAAREPIAPNPAPDSADPPSRQEEMEHFHRHLERALDSRGFLDRATRDLALTKLRRLFVRARPTSGELKMLRSLARLIHRDHE
jgi:tRNA (cytidine32/uridine32-2'-O)-methyltransferase